MAQTGEDNANLPILYMIPGSFFSEIALLGLHEKNIKYSPIFVKLSEMENLSPWFLEINPIGQVPVLQDEGKTIIGSDKILIHLAEKHGHDRSYELEKVRHFDQLFRTKIVNAVLTFGLILNPELSPGLKIPEYEQAARIAGLQNIHKQFEVVEKMHKEIPEIVKQKKSMIEFFRQKVSSKEEVKKEILSLGAILENVEQELASHEHKDWWLCCEHFTLPDFYLGVLLHRLDLLDLSSRLLDPKSLPKLIQYKDRVEQSPWFQTFLADVERLHKLKSTESK